MDASVTNMKKQRLEGFILAFMAGLMWGVSGPIAQYLFDSKGVIAEWLVPYRLMAAGVLLLIYAMFKKLPIISVWQTKKDGARLVAFAIFGMMGMQYAFFASVQEMNAGTATIFQYLNVAMLIVYFAVRYRTKPTKIEIIALLCSMAGIFLVATHGNIHSLSISNFGIVLGLATALVTCFYGVLPIPLLHKYPAQVVSAWAMIIGGVVLSFITKPWQIATTVDMGVAIGVLSIVIIGTILPFCFYLTALSKVGAVYTGLLSGVEPVAATAIAAIFLGTKFTAIDLVGFVLVLSTMFILNIGNREKEKKDD